MLLFCQINNQTIYNTVVGVLKLNSNNKTQLFNTSRVVHQQ